MDKLSEARSIITRVDKEMAVLFEERMKAAELVAEYKKEHALPILDSAQEALVIARGVEMIKNTEYAEYYSQFIKDVMKISRAYQSRLNEGVRVAYCGTTGAYAHIAALRLFPEATLVACSSFEEAYKSVENGECDSCVLPLENSYAGDVSTVTDLMFSGSLYVNKTINLPISHCLVANEGVELSQIKRVASHPQALTQCADYIKQLGATGVTYENTALAAQWVKDEGLCDTAAIASFETAEMFGMKILAQGINTSRTNTTRFGAFSRGQSFPSAGVKKMNQRFILMFTVRNEAGALAKTIDIIGAHGFNMCNLHSRPMKELLWSYYFYVEADGSINTQNGRDMLQELNATCDKLKLVGAFVAD